MSEISPTVLHFYSYNLMSLINGTIYQLHLSMCTPKSLVTVEGFTSFPSNITGGKIAILLVRSTDAVL